MDNSELQGKTVLVTGASQGLGRVIAETLARAGCRVVVNCAHGRDNAEKVASAIRQSGGDAVVYAADVSDEKTVETMFAELGRTHGGVDILINNARLDPYRRSAEMTEGQWWDMVMAVNLKGTYLCSYWYLKQATAKKWGRIVNVSSVRSFIPAEPHMVAYGVSKLGQHGITRSFAEQGAPYGITANTVAPGMIVTENIAKRLTPEMMARETARIPLGRGGTMDEVVDAVMFVVRNGYVTGETININGGMHFAP